jgi:tRNA(Ile)-lysidine synthase
VPAADAALTVDEANTLLCPLVRRSALILAVSGGPDSTALMFLVARWASALKTKPPKLIAVTVDHGLRPEAADEARAVRRLARRLGVAHRTLRWQGPKPKTGLQQAARAARYRLLAAAARTAKADCVLTAHTLDDQAETVLIRMSRGSGLTGLCAMANASPVPAGGEQAITLIRPLLGVPKARLIATLAQAKIDFAHDPSNQDPRFTRARLRGVMPVLAREGLDAHRLAQLARRLRRAEAAIEAAVDEAARVLSPGPWSERGPITFPAEKFARLPAEVVLRLLGRAITRTGNEGPVELGKLETLHEGLATASKGATFRVRRTLGGALVTLTASTLSVERAPARRSGHRQAIGRTALTTGNFARRISANDGRMRRPETGK